MVRRTASVLCALVVCLTAAPAAAATSRPIHGTRAVATQRASIDVGKQAPADEIAPRSPSSSQSFAALGDNNTAIPADTNGAVGPNHLMVALNTQVRMQTRTGATLSTVSTDAFWASLGSPSTFDPRVLYDPFSNRWIFVIAADAEAASSALLVGVTQTNDPTGTWNLYRVDVDASDALWGDFPSVGFNKDWIVVHLNLFSGASFDHGNVYVFDKADLYASGSGRYTLFADTSGTNTLAPAVSYDNTATSMYLVANRNSAAGQIEMKTISGPLGSETLSAGSVITRGEAWSFQAPGGADFLPQLGSSQLIDAGDARMQSCVYRNGSIWCAQTVFLPAGGSPTRAAAQWWKLSPSGAIQQKGRIDDPGGTFSYAYPSIGVNANDAALIGYSRFSSTTYPSAAYVFRTAADLANTFQSETLLKAGEASYYKTLGSPQNRWGDYSATIVDPLNDVDFWTIQEYAATPSGGYDRWGTWWGKVGAPSFRFGAATYSVGEAGPSVTITVNRDGDTGGAGTVNFATSDDSATAGIDYTATSGTLSFAAGATTAAFDVPILQDATPEGEEFVRVALSTPNAGSSLGAPATATVGIVDDDPPAIQFASSALTVQESVGTTTVTVTRVGSAASPAGVDYATADGSAVAGADYAPASGTVAFAAGETSKTFTVGITNDATKEAAETVNLALSNATGATLGEPASVLLTVGASDQQPDGLIKASGDSSYLGNNVYNTTGTKQTRSVSAARKTKKTFYVRVQNDGNVSNTFRARGCGSSTGYSVRYYLGSSSTSLTSAVVNGTYTGGSLPPGSARTIRLEITVSSGASVGGSKGCFMTSTWTGDGAKKDYIKAIVKVVS